MDGRTQLPVIEYMKRKFGVDYVDMITEPGPIRFLAENQDEAVVNSIRRRVEISVVKHGSKYIGVVGHHDCAGNPVDKERQLKQISESIKTIQSWKFKVDVIGLWVDEHWRVNEVK